MNPVQVGGTVAQVLNKRGHLHPVGERMERTSTHSSKLILPSPFESACLRSAWTCDSGGRGS